MIKNLFSFRYFRFFAELDQSLISRGQCRDLMLFFHRAKNFLIAQVENLRTDKPLSWEARHPTNEGYAPQGGLRTHWKHKSMTSFNFSLTEVIFVRKNEKKKNVGPGIFSCETAKIGYFVSWNFKCRSKITRITHFASKGCPRTFGRSIRNKITIT